MRDRIARERGASRNRFTRDLEIGVGGIMSVERAAQYLQLVSVTASRRSRSTDRSLARARGALDKLARRSGVPDGGVLLDRVERWQHDIRAACSARRMRHVDRLHEPALLVGADPRACPRA
jgi:hypothetical protein